MGTIVRRWRVRVRDFGPPGVEKWWSLRAVLKFAAYRVFMLSVGQLEEMETNDAVVLHSPWWQSGPEESSRGEGWREV